MNNKAVVKFADYKLIKRLSIKEWKDAAAMLEVLLNNGYTATVEKDEVGYTIEYDWKDIDWCDHMPMWVDPNWYMIEDDNENEDIE